MIMQTLTTRLLDGHLLPRLTRLIPHPAVRLVATLAASFVVPLVVEKLLTKSAGLIASHPALVPLPRAVRK